MASLFNIIIYFTAVASLGSVSPGAVNLECHPPPHCMLPHCVLLRFKERMAREQLRDFGNFLLEESSRQMPKWIVNFFVLVIFKLFLSLMVPTSLGVERPIHRDRLTPSENIFPMLLWRCYRSWGSPQYEKLYKRGAALGSLRTTVVVNKTKWGGGDTLSLRHQP